MIETKTIVSGDELQAIFQQQNWSELWLKLLAHTIHRFKYRYGLKVNNITLQQKSREIVQDVINLVFIEEKRKWNIDAYLTLDAFLFSAIDSHIYNSFKTKPKEISGQEDSVFENRNNIETNSLENISTKELRTQIINELNELKADDDELLVFECLFDGIEKPEDIRKELGISEDDFHNIWRRVNRKRDKLKTKLSRYGY